MQQILQNQFGMDRDGFRALVLSPIPRHQILFGKNLATAPFALGIGRYIDQLYIYFTRCGAGFKSLLKA